MKPDPFKELQHRLQVRFRRIGLLKQAFTHTSYVNEHRRGSAKHNERLEFLGDAVLQLIVSDYLYVAYPTRPEGELTRMRAAIVCEPSLAGFAELLDFGAYVQLGRGEEQLGGRSRPALLADLFEAFVGALYLDQGLEAVRLFLTERIFPRVEIDGPLMVKDYKSKLQERVQHRSLGAVDYRVTEERGPAHDREFVVDVYVGANRFGSGSGRTKKEAEQRAASEAYARLSADDE
ncbi:ribonuclease III [Paenibacillaceae bacterium]|nr:ribonuclease III [Paenibacillaceae bacterium]